MVNSSINPFIYIACNENFKKELYWRAPYLQRMCRNPCAKTESHNPSNNLFVKPNLPLRPYTCEINLAHQTAQFQNANRDIAAREMKLQPEDEVNKCGETEDVMGICQLSPTKHYIKPNISPGINQDFQAAKSVAVEISRSGEKRRTPSPAAGVELCSISNSNPHASSNSCVLYKSV